MRKKAGLTQEKLAEKMNLSTNMISKIEQGVSGTTLDNIEIIAEILNTKVDYLAYGISVMVVPEEIYTDVMKDKMDEEVLKFDIGFEDEE